jgi:hypothetical protein
LALTAGTPQAVTCTTGNYLKNGVCKPIPVCSAGMTLNSAYECLCNADLKLVNNTCVCKVTGQTLVNNLCACKNNQIVRNNTCGCSLNSILTNGVCINCVNGKPDTNKSTCICNNSSKKPNFKGICAI